MPSGVNAGGSVLEKLMRQLVRDEGLKLKPYHDSVGKLTIGIGRNLEDRGITSEEALYLLRNDAREVIETLPKVLPWTDTLDEARQGVLLNMAFNLGMGGLLGFYRMLRAVKAGEWAHAVEEMEKSQWARQVGPRAYRLMEQMRSGEWK